MLANKSTQRRVSKKELPQKSFQKSVTFTVENSVIWWRFWPGYGSPHLDLLIGARKQKNPVLERVRIGPGIKLGAGDTLYPGGQGLETGRPRDGGVAGWCHNHHLAICSTLNWKKHAFYCKYNVYPNKMNLFLGWQPPLPIQLQSRHNCQFTNLALAVVYIFVYGLPFLCYLAWSRVRPFLER